MSEQDPIITKRLHVSGLTPSITQSDLAQRLATFGTVEALDGFGQFDALGQPRKFAYVTFKAPKTQLARCMNLLSGTTWKGTKLRIGEAKPGFQERISREIENATAERPKKRRRFAGVYASDMSLVTPENVHLRNGWRVTPLGRLIRQMRMRPLRPIPPPAPQTSLRKKDADAKKKPKRRFKQALSRARRRTINPLRWGSQHLKGAFLDSRNVIIVERENRAHPVEKESETEEDSDTDSEGDRQDAPITVEDHFEPTPTPKAAIAKAKPAVPVRGPSPPIAEENNLAREKMQSLIVLDSMFAGLEEDQEWGGKESVDSDVDMGDVQPSQEEAEIAVDSTPSPIPATPPPPPTTSAQSKLKALFAPQEEQGFSLLGHLDLDLELEEELPSFTSAPQTRSAVEPAPISAAFTYNNVQITFDPKQPLFFPMSEESRISRGKVKDILDVMKDKGGDWRDGFYRTESAEEITKRWEETKGDLTRDWKRRHREAVKSRRRRGGGDGD